MANRSATRTREIGPLSIRAEFAPSTLNPDKRTVQLTWTTGARVLRGSYDPYWEELSLDPKHVRLDRLRSGSAPLLANHNSGSLDDVIGVVESAQLDAGGVRGSATVRFDRGAAGEEAYRKVSDGILRNVSVGYRTYKYQRVEDGDDTTPVYRAVDWEPHELSLVPIGADAGAYARAATTTTTNPCDFTEEKKMDPEETPAGANAGASAARSATNAAPAAQPAPAPTTALSTDHVRAERERVLGIQRIGRALKRPDVDITAAITAGTSLDAFRATAQDAFAEAETIQLDRRDPHVSLVDDNRDKWMRGAGAWLIQRSAVGGVLAQHAKQSGQQIELAPGEFRGLRLIDLARQSLERAGVRTAGMLPMQLIGEAFTRSSPTATTGDFPILLENVIYKTLLASYGITPDTWTGFCSVGSVQDFRPSKRYRLGTFGALMPLNESGEFANKSIPDAERQSIVASTKGCIIGLSRQAIINDDMGAFSTLATAYGRAAKLSIEVDVYALLALNGGLGPVMNDGNTLFHASHGNITAGAAIGSNAIDADRVAMANQKDPSGNEVLALRPAVLVLPVGLGGTARQINNGQYDFDVTNKFQVPNKVGGLFRDIIDTPRIAGTRRYLFADQGIAPTIEVAFLDGQQQPYLDIQQGWRIDGVEWKVRMDYGVGAIDFRGAITNAGA